MFNKIPTTRPITPLLDAIASPEDLRSLPDTDLPELASQLRHFLLYTVGQTGGHFGAGLGVIELTIALHYVFQTPADRLIWDVGHQTYPHKILTGRRELMHLLRKPDGIAPFPDRQESPYDTFGTGHSSTSISAALGMELAARLADDPHKTLLVIGDGAMTAGMAFEGLNHVAACHADILIVLNDNAMSISENVGGLANYFARNISANELSPGVEHQAASVPGSIFRDLGFSYSGPIDGHDLPLLIETLQTERENSGPRILHILTQKGKGYGPAETSPVASHALTKLEKKDEPNITYARVFGDWACRRAAQDPGLVAIPPAMKEGSSLVEFAEQYPNRFHDVAIAEQHAVTLAAGLAAGGAKPVVAIYSTFLQRGYDQLIHDIAIQNLDVLFAVDRASLLEDGPTHSGIFDLSYTRAIPNLVIMTPSDSNMLRAMLDFGFDYPGPAIVRYPRGAIESNQLELHDIELGRAKVVRAGNSIAILVFGTLLGAALEVANEADYTVIDMRFVKPLDRDAVIKAADDHDLLVTLEENVRAAGAGSAVLEAVSTHPTPVLCLGVPDAFVDQDSPANMQIAAGISAEKIRAAILTQSRD